MEQDKIVIEHLNLWYGSFQALKDINLRLPANEITAFIGPSGCGKSTLLKSLNRMNDLVEGCRIEGTVTLDGEDIFSRKMDVNLLRKRVGMVFQKPNPFPMSIYDNVAYGPRTHGVRSRVKLDEIVEKSLRGAAIWDEVKDRLKKSALGMSGGQQQRLCIARALAVEPEVLLMDEATSALDPKTTRQILELIQDINRKLGITVVVITHQMSVVEEICDSVAILDGGVVVEQGEVREIFANPKTAAPRRLVAPNGGSAARDLSSFAPDDHVVRVTFNGSSAAKPLVASLAAEKGILVSVLSADTRDLSGQCYGSMLLKLPRDTEQAKQAAAYMRSQNGVTVEEVTGE